MLRAANAIVAAAAELQSRARGAGPDQDAWAVFCACVVEYGIVRSPRRNRPGAGRPSAEARRIRFVILAECAATPQSTASVVERVCGALDPPPSGRDVTAQLLRLARAGRLVASGGHGARTYALPHAAPP